MTSKIGGETPLVPPQPSRRRSDSERSLTPLLGALPQRSQSAPLSPERVKPIRGAITPEAVARMGPEELRLARERLSSTIVMLRRSKDPKDLAMVEKLSNLLVLVRTRSKSPRPSTSTPPLRPSTPDLERRVALLERNIGEDFSPTHEEKAEIAALRQLAEKGPKKQLKEEFTPSFPNWKYNFAPMLSENWQKL